MSIPEWWKGLSTSKQQRVAFLLHRTWFLLVSIGAIYVYIEAIYLVQALFADLPTLSNALRSKASSGIGIGLQLLGGVLFWWRVTKVMVLLGSPFPLMAKFSYGRWQGAVGGQNAILVHIGTAKKPKYVYRGEFWFGALLRGHSKSDKLSRSRLEFLTIHLVRGWTLEIMESRFAIRKRDHTYRATLFQAFRGNYSAELEPMPPSKFRENVVLHLEAIRRQGEHRAS